MHCPGIFCRRICKRTSVKMPPPFYRPSPSLSPADHVNMQYKCYPGKQECIHVDLQRGMTFNPDRDLWLRRSLAGSVKRSERSLIGWDRNLGQRVGTSNILCLPLQLLSSCLFAFPLFISLHSRTAAPMGNTVREPGKEQVGAGGGRGRSGPVWPALSPHADTVRGGVTLSSATMSGSSLAQAV